MATKSRPIVRKTVSILSPLRYPGAKRRLASYIAKVFDRNNLKPKLFVEPFAGGLSVSLQMLQDGLVDRIAFGERDPLVASFWKVAFFDTDWLVAELEDTPITLERWKHFRTATFDTDRERALACLFLNRTSFSGILAASAGPIGGQAQSSDYRIDCRFNVSSLQKRLEKLALLSDKVVFVQNKSWLATMNRVAGLGYEKKDVFYYLDPPFYLKADRLYRYFFSDAQHQQLHDKLLTIKSPWLLSYDKAKTILEKYTHNGKSPRRIGFLYSAASEAERSETKELIITNLSSLPTETRIWRSESEWRKKAHKTNAKGVLKNGKNPSTD